MPEITEMIAKTGSFKSMTDTALKDPLKHSLEEVWPDFVSYKEGENKVIMGSPGEETLKSF